MDFSTIGTALASTFGTVTANGETATATAQLPNQVAKLALLVYPPTGDLGLLMGTFTNAHLTYPVKLLRDPVDMPSRTAALLAWATAIWSLPLTNYDLGVAGVIEARPTDIRIEIDGEQYASLDGTRAFFDVVELTVDVHVYELTTVTP